MVLETWPGEEGVEAVRTTLVFDPSIGPTGKVSRVREESTLCEISPSDLHDGDRIRPTLNGTLQRTSGSWLFSLSAPHPEP